MTSRGYNAGEFQAKLNKVRSSIPLSREDRAELHEMAQLVDGNAAPDAADQIVDLVLSGKRPDRSLLEEWCRGGAVFWQDDHLSLGEGWPLSTWFGAVEEDLPRGDPERAVAVLRETWDDWYRSFGQLFGKVPIRATDGREVVLISTCGFGMTDTPLHVVRSEAFFMRMVRVTGMLWARDFPNGDPMQADDAVLLQHVTRAEKFAPK